MLFDLFKHLILLPVDLAVEDPEARDALKAGLQAGLAGPAILLDPASAVSTAVGQAIQSSRYGASALAKAAGADPRAADQAAAFATGQLGSAVKHGLRGLVESAGAAALGAAVGGAAQAASGGEVNVFDGIVAFQGGAEGLLQGPDDLDGLIEVDGKVAAALAARLAVGAGMAGAAGSPGDERAAFEAGFGWGADTGHVVTARSLSEGVRAVGRLAASAAAAGALAVAEGGSPAAVLAEGRQWRARAEGWTAATLTAARDGDLRAWATMGIRAAELATGAWRRPDRKERAVQRSFRDLAAELEGRPGPR